MPSWVHLQAGRASRDHPVPILRQETASTTSAAPTRVHPVGTRLKVLINVEGQDDPSWFAGTVQRVSRQPGRAVHFVLFDDGDKEDLDLATETYELLPSEFSTRKGPTPLWLSVLQDRWRAELADLPEAEREEIVDVLAASKADGTRSTYGSAQKSFLNFCAQRSLQALPASATTVMRWVHFLTKPTTAGGGGTVHPDSLQPYLSGVNALHRDAGLEPPALGDDVSSMRKGASRKRRMQIDAGLQPEDISTDRLRVYIPATVMKKVRDKAFEFVKAMPRARARVELFRASTFSFLDYCLFSRSDTGTKLKMGDLHRTAEGWHITLRNLKGKKHKGYIKPLLFPHGAVPYLDEVLTAFTDLRTRQRAQPDDNLWRLPWESRTTWPSALGDGWLQQALQAVGSPSPLPGEVWTSHSLRKGAATAAYAINVTLLKICYVGDWSDRSSTVNDYVDPTAVADPDMHLFFGWLRPSGGGT